MEIKELIKFCKVNTAQRYVQNLISVHILAYQLVKIYLLKN
jgi:hypothetical protein